MSTEKHSELPWKLKVSSDGDDCEILTETGKEVIVDQHGCCWPANIQDGELIIKAVNNLSSLVKALKVQACNTAYYNGQGKVDENTMNRFTQRPIWERYLSFEGLQVLKALGEIE